MKAWIRELMKIIAIALIFIAAIYFGCDTYKQTHTPNQNAEIEYNDTIAILTLQEDSLRAKYAQIINNIDNQYKIQLTNQRKYYENEITRVKHLNADSTLSLFATYTSRRNGHISGSSD